MPAASLAATETDLQRLQVFRAPRSRVRPMWIPAGSSWRISNPARTIRFYEEKLRSTRGDRPGGWHPIRSARKVERTRSPRREWAAVADLRKIRVRAYVDEPEMGGATAESSGADYLDAVPNETWKGVTGPVPREVVTHLTRSVGEVLCTVDNQDQRLIPNINVNVRI